jgi:hypothetical protein
MAITRAQQVRQMLEDGGMLVSPSKDGKRPGYRRSKYDASGGGTRSSKSAPGSPGPGSGPSARERQMGSQGKTGKVDKSIDVGGPGPDDRSSALQTAITQAALGQSLPPQLQKPIELNKREQEFKKFLDYRKPVNFPNFSIFKPFENVAQKFSNFNASINRPFFEKVIRAGKIPGLSFDMDADDFEKAYQNYMSERLAGNIDAYGNPLMGGKDRGPDDQILFSADDGDDGDGGDGGNGGNNNTNTGGLAIRFRKDGGRINANEGGIMKASYGYDDAMGEAFEEFLRLKKIREIPEDMEFDEYLDQLDIDVPYSRKDRGEQRTMAQEGGIMDLETGRQMYFLGKLVKKATRAVKKITKSPLGKAAILGGLAYFGGGGASIFKNKGLGGLFSNFFSKKNPLLFDAAGKLSMGKLAGLSAISPFLFQQEEEEDDEFYRGPGLDTRKIRENPYDFLGPNFANGGRIGYQEGSKEPVAKKTMPLLDMGGKEMDLRDNGGFVPIGRMEKADDVPARLSKNEFVFTADAVRNAGEGDVDKGAEVMYNMMKNLESGGEVSEESQGLEGARRMFQTSKRLEEVL